MKKNIMLAMATIIVATFFLTKVNKEEKMSDLTLANIEALANNEFDNGYFCYGTGKVICPYSGQQVAGYFIRRNIE